ncbi:hypothetical protein Zm00014a_010054 [Zea mays]|uniref:Uncharacterized protein n=1 Tax=Zea mays TaxID=4577 RepID=A0A317Y0U4_MAIZE|nr:hypothetical protein Zm00014a_010054 [Zea mays]
MPPPHLSHACPRPRISLVPPSHPVLRDPLWCPDRSVLAKVVTYQVRKISSGMPQGVLNLSYKLSEVTQTAGANGYTPTQIAAYPPPSGKAGAYAPLVAYPPPATDQEELWNGARGQAVGRRRRGPPDRGNDIRRSPPNTMANAARLTTTADLAMTPAGRRRAASSSAVVASSSSSLSPGDSPGLLRASSHGHGD